MPFRTDGFPARTLVTASILVGVMAIGLAAAAGRLPGPEANQSGGNVIVFRIDQATGELQPTEASVQVANPVCVRFMEIQ